jgi:hypothetical protein
LSNSDNEDDYPSFHHQRSCSHPWPRRTVFHQLGYSGSSSDPVGANEGRQ